MNWLASLLGGRYRCICPCNLHVAAQVYHSDDGLLMQWFNLVRCFCFGLSGAYDTLGSQAFGSGNKVIAVCMWDLVARVLAI